jgi:hypothetical protein
MSSPGARSFPQTLTGPGWCGHDGRFETIFSPGAQAASPFGRIPGADPGGPIVLYAYVRAGSVTHCFLVEFSVLRGTIWCLWSAYRPNIVQTGPLRWGLIFGRRAMPSSCPQKELCAKPAHAPECLRAVAVHHNHGDAHPKDMTLAELRANTAHRGSSSAGD